MKNILVAGMSKDKFTERIFSNLVKKNFVIDSLTGFHNWNSKNVNHTVNATSAMSPHGLKDSFHMVNPEILDRDILDYFNRARPYFLRVLDRFSIKPISEREAEQYFNDCISYILAYLKKDKKYDLCFSLYSPHSPTGIITYYACKYLGIPYFFGVRTLLPELIMFSDDFEAKEPTFFKFDKTKFKDDITLNTRNDINYLLSEPVWLLDAGKAINKTGNWYLSNKNHSGSLLSVIARNKYVIPYVPFLKFILDFTKLILTGNFLRNEFYKLKRFEAIKLIIKNIKLTRTLLKWQKNNSKKRIEAKNYFYFSMHYQPERTTDPEANYFTQQYLAIKLLSTALPDGYILYVKDHPRQFVDKMDIAKVNFRNIHEYEAINSLPNTFFLDPEIDSKEIIKNAKLVSACTGSALWEALLECVPSISFGFTWHADCESSPNFSSVKSINDQIKKLLEKDKKNVKDDLYEFILKNKDCFIQSHFGEIMANESKLDTNLLADNFSAAIEQLAEQKI